jgi:hypothetical protein
MSISKKPKNGIREGFARTLSQSCVYPIERRKTLLQVYGCVPKNLQSHNLIRGCATSCITAGIVFFSYFSIYNRFNGSPFAGSIAAFVTSFIKLPIGNSMRIMQTGKSPSIFHAARKLCEKDGLSGLYKGYGVCLIEDAIDMDLRMRLYNLFTYHTESSHKSSLAHFNSIGFGALSGVISCGVTTPFDTIRAHMCFETATNSHCNSSLNITRNLWKNHGLKGFYRGMPLRMSSNALKSGLFFWFLDILQYNSKEHI